MPLREIPVEVWENVIDQLRKWVVLRRPEQVPQLAKLVRKGLWEVESCRTVTILPHYDESLRTLGLFAAMFAGKMPRLQTLNIGCGKWVPGEMHMDVFLHLSAFVSITHLRLRDVTFPSVQTFGRLVSAFPSVTNLECKMVKFNTHDFEAGAFLRRSRNLVSLDLKENHRSWAILLGRPRQVWDPGVAVFGRRISSFFPPPL